MRICITQTAKGRYSETFIRNQVRALSERATVFSLHGGRLPQRDEKNKLLPPYAFWLMHLVAKSVTGRRNNYFGNYGLKKFLKKNKIDVVLANYGIAGVHILPVCKSLNIPLVVHFHGFDASQKKILEQYGEAYKILFREAAAIIVVSNDMKDKLIFMGAPANKVFLIPCGVDTEKFKPGVISKQQKTFLSVGRFIEKKSPQSTIKAFAGVLKFIPDTKLVMIGKESGLFDECKNLVQQLNINNNIVFTGTQSPGKIVQYMQMSNVFVQHSVTAFNGDMEGTPTTISEASACELPIVSTKHAGIKEAVIHGKTGFLVDEHDINSMAEYMKQLIENPGMAIAMGKAGREHIIENYDLEKQTDKLFNVLKAAAGKN